MGKPPTQSSYQLVLYVGCTQVCMWVGEKTSQLEHWPNIMLFDQHGRLVRSQFVMISLVILVNNPFENTPPVRYKIFACAYSLKLLDNRMQRVSCTLPIAVPVSVPMV